MRKTVLATASLFALTAVASAQTLPQGLVTVNLQNVLSDIAVDLNVEQNSIPVNVQVPLSVAANVCGVDVNALSVQVDSGNATCVAQTGSQEVIQVVQQQVSSGGSNSSGVSANSGSGSASNGGNDADGDDVAAGKGKGNKNGNGNAPGTDDTETGSTSAREFAPGQQAGPAKEAAPGLSNNMAPGQAKKACESAGDCPAD